MQATGVAIQTHFCGGSAVSENLNNTYAQSTSKQHQAEPTYFWSVFISLKPIGTYHTCIVQFDDS